MAILFIFLNLIIIASIILFLIYRQKILRPGKFGKLINRNKAKWIMGTYGAILLISVIFLYCIPNKNFLPRVPNEEIYNQNVQRFPQDIINAALEQRIEKTEGIIVAKEWNFNFSGKELDFKNSILLNDQIQVFIEKKAENDNKIEIAEYMTKTIFNGIDYTKSIKSPKIDLIGSNLKIIEPEKYTINLISFNKEFTITQFAANKGNQQNYGYNIGSPRILYLRIPKDVKILESYLNIQYVGENK